MRFCALLLALLLVGCQSGPADWTLMFYVAADNDLEASELGELRDVLGARVGQAIHLTALVDRAEGTEEVPGQGRWRGARWLRLENGQAQLVEDWGPQNLADPAVLRRFLEKATGAFPARRYGLVLAGHGKGWRGMCVDEGAPGELLEPTELGTALAGCSLELLVLDACLMGTLEVAAAVAPRAHYLVASEELIPWSGLAYREPLERLSKNPEADGRQLGEWLLEAYGPSLQDEDQPTALLALLDLSRLAPLQRGVELLAGRLEHLPRAELARWRQRSPQFGRREETGEPDAEQFDLALLAPELAAAVETAMVRVYRGRERALAGGLAIGFPEQPDSTYSLPGWSGLLRTYARRRE